MFGDDTSGGEFVSDVGAQGDRPHRPSPAACQRHHRTGVDPTREHGGDRIVWPAQPGTHRLVEHVRHPVHRFVRGHDQAMMRWPPGACGFGHGGTRHQGHGRTRLYPTYAGETGGGFRARGGERIPRPFGKDLGLGGDVDTVGTGPQVERDGPGVIGGHHHAVVLGDDGGEPTIAQPQPRRPVTQPAGQQQLGVGEAIGRFAHHGPQFRPVVELARQQHGHPVVAGHGRRPGVTRQGPAAPVRFPGGLGFDEHGYRVAGAHPRRDRPGVGRGDGAEVYREPDDRG